MRPCGHAAHVDGVDSRAAHPAHNRLGRPEACPHDHKADDEDCTKVEKQLHCHTAQRRWNGSLAAITENRGRFAGECLAAFRRIRILPPL